MNPAFQAPTAPVYANPTDILPGGMAAVSLDDRSFLRVSPGLAQLTDYECPADLMEAAGGRMAGLFCPTDRPCVRAALDQLLPGDGKAKVECRILRRDHPPLWVTLCTGLVASEVWGPYLECFFLDLTDLRRTEAELARRCRLLAEKTRREGMTGLLNKEAFREDVKARLASDGGTGYALLVLDLDDFKGINDRFGHTYGDKVIQTFSAALVSTFGPDALCGRYGGDEFVVFLPQIASDEVAPLLRDFYAGLRCRRAGDLPYRCSTGAVWAKGAQTFGLLFDTADTALYDAKKKGKARFVVSYL